MKSSSGRIIKSEEVKYIPAPERVDSGSSVGPSSHSAGATQAYDMERMRESFTRKIQQAEQKAYAAGVADGIQKGIDLQRNDGLQPLQSLTGLIMELGGLKKATLENAEEQILQLSLAIAKKVIHLEVTTSRDVIQGVLKEAIKNIVDRENMKIRINPQDFRYMMEIKSDFLQNFDGIKNVVFEEDSSIGRGGALIETMHGEVDARLDQQYDEIKALLNPHGRR